MSFVKRAYAALIAFVTTTEDPASLAIARVVAAGTLFVHIVRMLTSGAAVFAWTSDDGIAQHTGFVLDALGGATERNILALCVLCALFSFSACVGFMTRPSLFLASGLFRILYGTAYDARGAYDNLLVDGLFLLMLSGCGRALSVDAWLAARKALSRTSPSSQAQVATRWPRMLLVLQMGLLYGGSAMMKASSGWVPGGDADALWYILHQPMWARFDHVPQWTFHLTQVSTTMVWCWELCGPIFVLSVFLRERDLSRCGRVLGALKRALDRVHFRELYLVVGVAMHVGIEVTMDVGAFTGASLALYSCAIRPSEWRALFATVKRRLGLTDNS